MNDSLDQVDYPSETTGGCVEIPATVLANMQLTIPDKEMVKYITKLNTALQTYSSACSMATTKLSSFHYNELLTTCHCELVKFIQSTQEALLSIIRQLTESSDVASCQQKYKNDLTTASTTYAEHMYNGIDKYIKQTDAVSHDSALVTKPLANKAEHVGAEHSYVIKESPRVLKRKLHLTVSQLSLHIKRRKAMQQKVWRLKTRLTSLSQITDKLKSEKLISDSCASILTTSLNEIPLEVIQRAVNDKKLGHISRTKYSSAI